VSELIPQSVNGHPKRKLAHHSACVGRNLAAMELSMIIASITRRFDFELECPGQMVSSNGIFVQVRWT